MNLSRRKFLTVGLVAVGAGATVHSVASATQLQSPTLTKLSIKIDALPKEFWNYRIAFISDVHVGHYLDAEYLRAVCDAISNEHPDLVLLGGDYIWIEHSTLAKSLAQLKVPDSRRTVPELIEEMFKKSASVLATIKNSDGIFGVMGNHDRWEDPAQCLYYFNKAQVPLLVNEEKIITRGQSRLSIIGVDDYWTGYPNLDFMPKRKSKNSVRVILSHNPDFISFYMKRDPVEFDLALCGHTHGGQIKLPLLGPIAYNIRDRRLMEGLVSMTGGAQVFTSRGIGMVEVPLRINCPPEIAILTLVPEAG